MSTFEEQLQTVIFAITPTEPAAEDRAWARLDALTKPPRSLGTLEQIAAQVARIQGTDHPTVDSKEILSWPATTASLPRACHRSHRM